MKKNIFELGSASDCMPIGFKKYFEYYDFPIIVEYEMFLTEGNNGKKIKLETNDEFELKEFYKQVQKFKDKSKDVNWTEYDKWLADKKDNELFECVKKLISDINQTLEYFSEKWKKAEK